MAKVPKQKAKRGVPSQDQGEYDGYRDLCEVGPMIDQVRIITGHVTEFWFDDEIVPAIRLLHEASAALVEFKRLASGHYDRVIDETGF